MKCRALQAGISRANVGQYGQCGEDMRDVIKLSTYFFFTPRKLNGLITRHGCGYSGIGKEIIKM
jgi:hypothetical protein